jgi:hypothetical protein
MGAAATTGSGSGETIGGAEETNVSIGFTGSGKVFTIFLGAGILVGMLSSGGTSGSAGGSTTGAGGSGVGAVATTGTVAVCRCDATK